MGRGGPANSTFRRSAGACELDFFACGWLADLFMEHDVGGIGPARQTVWAAEPPHQRRFEIPRDYDKGN
jgi:hypothetical protein